METAEATVLAGYAPPAQASAGERHRFDDARHAVIAFDADEIDLDEADDQSAKDGNKGYCPQAILLEESPQGFQKEFVPEHDHFLEDPNANACCKTQTQGNRAQNSRVRYLITIQPAEP
jgi:hypothetical protein